MEANQTPPVTSPASGPVEPTNPPPAPPVTDQAPPALHQMEDATRDAIDREHQLIEESQHLKMPMIPGPGKCLACGTVFTSPNGGEVSAMCFCGGKMETVKAPATDVSQPAKDETVTDQAPPPAPAKKQWHEASEKKNDGGWVAPDRRPGFCD